jgi:hypothetical protein
MEQKSAKLVPERISCLRWLGFVGFVGVEMKRHSLSSARAYAGKKPFSFIG